MDENVEKRARQAVAAYHKYKWTGIGILAAGTAYLIYLLFKLDYRLGLIYGGLAGALMELSILAGYLIFALVSSIVRRIGAIKIHETLTKECDPFVYEACFGKLRMMGYRDRVMCVHAVAQYYQGDFERAWDTLQRINVQKLKRGFKYNYYVLLSALYFKRGMGERVPELEQAFRAGMKKTEQKYFRMLCAANNRIRAVLNKDYRAAFHFQQEEKEALGNAAGQRWREIMYSFWAAQIYAGLGEKESARINAQYVVENGGRLFCVEEAGKLLEQLGTGGF